ncbi:MAG: hypothetical protein WBQ08_11590 [Candidatus Sulfotelmatobacter sp.]
MNAKCHLFVTVAEAALVLTVTSWAFIFVYSFFVHDMSVHGRITVVPIIFVPDFLATWWIFRRLRADHSRTDARRAATAFAVSAPATLAIALALGELIGGYAGVVFGSRSILPAVVTFVIALMISVPSAVVAWTLHPSGGTGPVGESGQDEHR